MARHTSGRRLARIALRLLVLYLVISLAAAIIITELTFHPIRRPLPPDVAAHPERFFAQASTSEVAIRAHDGTDLRAWYVKPRNDNGSAVVMLHGLSDNRLGVAGYSRFLLAAGYRLLFPDSRAHGESGGAIATFGLLEAGDAHEWVSWLYTHDPPQCTYGFGESMGAAILLQSLPREPRICAAVAESSFATFREAAYERIGEYFGMGPKWFGQTIGRPVVWFASLYSKIRYGQDLMRANPAESVAHSSTPVLLIHGTDDRNLLPRNSQQIAAARNDSVELWLVAGAQHTGAYASQPEQFESRVIGWFRSHPK